MNNPKILLPKNLSSRGRQIKQVNEQARYPEIAANVREKISSNDVTKTWCRAALCIRWEELSEKEMWEPRLGLDKGVCPFGSQRQQL